MPLDPSHLTPSASLNRAQVVGLTGIDLDPDIQGRRGAELLSQAAIAALVRDRAAALGLTAAMTAEADGALVAALDERLAGMDAATGAADAIAAQLGRRLAALLAMLRRGDPANRAARPEWDASYWDHWARVRRVWLGGGVAAGTLGATIARHARAELPRLGAPDLELRLAPSWASMLPLIGAARSLPPEAEGGLVCDFGHSSVKASYARITNGALIRLTPLPRSPVPFAMGALADAARDAVARDVQRWMADLLCAHWVGLHAQGLPLSDEIRVSVASYIDARSNRALPAGGLYALADSAEPGLAMQLSASLSEQAGRTVAVRLMHDGTAAACTFAGVSGAAVLMLGTALGVGFPPTTEAGLLPLEPAFAVHVAARSGSLSS